MGEVWLARRKTLGAVKTVALKMTRPDRDDGRSMALFQQEAQISMLMSHPNVVQAFDAGRAGGRSYLAMEWVDGVSLIDVMTQLHRRGRRASHDVVAHVVRSLLLALAHVHAVPRPGRPPICVVHSDVSPHNVLVSKRGEVKLADFGVAVVPGVRGSQRVVGGKPRYMAPEQLRGANNHPRTDLFGVGAILHELLSGQRFPHAEGTSTCPKAAIPPLSDRSVPRDLRELRLALLEPDPRKRPTAEDALRLLEHARPEREAAAELGRLCREARREPTSPTRSATLRDEVTEAQTGTETLDTWSMHVRRPPIARWLRPDPRSFLVGVLTATLSFTAAALTVSLLAQ
jgi:serine/threonine protein kinase